jgi:hypothetical protein
VQRLLHLNRGFLGERFYDLSTDRHIPSSATVTGEGGWETVFGKPEATAGWTWGELMAGIDKTSAWEYQICSMMAEAIKTRSVQFPSIALRISVRGAQAAEDIYRIGLGRVSEFEEEYEFVFILFRVRTPFEPSEDDRETMLYHLFNLAWHFRRRFVERHRQTMEDLADQQMRDRNKEDFQNELAEAVRTVKIGLKSLEADAQVRGLDRAAKVRRAFDPSERDKLDQLLIIEWPPLQRRLEEAIKKASPDPQEIHGILTEMEPINRWFYQRSVAQLSPGWIELTVPNADKADGFAFEVLLEDSRQKVTTSKVIGAKQWIRPNLFPGQYKASVIATVHGNPILVTTAIPVKSGEGSKADLLLPM